MSIVVLLTFLTLIPSLLMCVTPFARLLVVFHFLRQALGLQSTPSNQTLIGLSLILTFFIMQPVGAALYQNALMPLQEGKITAMDALKRGEDPMRKFMLHYVREKDVALFVELAKEPRPRTPDDLSLRVLVPAYILSELKAGFQIGSVLLLPFLVIDMVVASITTSVGMMQLPPVVISTPIKLLLFVMVDGWNLLVSSLMKSFYCGQYANRSSSGSRNSYLAAGCTAGWSDPGCCSGHQPDHQHHPGIDVVTGGNALDSAKAGRGRRCALLHDALDVAADGAVHGFNHVGLSSICALNHGNSPHHYRERNHAGRIACVRPDDIRSVFREQRAGPPGEGNAGHPDYSGVVPGLLEDVAGSDALELGCCCLQRDGRGHCDGFCHQHGI
jgi:flagellar biosynthetic protein FliP